MCREFRLLAPGMLKGFRGRKSRVNCRSYVVLPPSVLGTSCGGGGVNSGSRRDRGGGRRCSSRAPTGRRWRSGNDGQGRRRDGREARSRSRTRNQGRGGAGMAMAMGSLLLDVVGSNSVVERGGGRSRSRRRRRRGRWHGREARGSHQRAAERDNRGSRRCRREGRTIPWKTLVEFGSRGHVGAMMILAFDFFLFVKNII